MTNPDDAAARVMIAEFEARRLNERSEQRVRRWRAASVVIRVLLVLSIGVYLQVAQPQVSGAQVGGLLSILVGAALLDRYRLGEKIRKLEADVDRLKAEGKERAA